MFLDYTCLARGLPGAVVMVMLISGSARAADVTGTSGDDFLFFQGNETTHTISQTNPYSGQTINVTDTFNVNAASYDGLGGNDILIMSNLSDVLYLRNPVTGDQDVTSVEIFFGGDGKDYILLADPTYAYANGPSTIDVGASDDVVWGNAGDETINGRQGNDILDGGPGDDRLNGGAGGGNNSGNDWLRGGTGADYLNGEDGNDTLVYTVDGTHSAGPYAGKNLSLDIFNGGAGFDVLEMTDGADVLLLEDTAHSFHSNGTPLRLIDVEEINAGDGDDVVDLMVDDKAYGDIIINGGKGNDRIISSLGDDVINGGEDDDYIHGGAPPVSISPFNSAGDDILRGGPGNDHLYGGFGNTLFEFAIGDGFDIIEGDPYALYGDPLYGFHESDDGIIFGPGITFSDLSLSLFDDDWLDISFTNNDDFIRSFSIDAFLFDDGSQVLDPFSLVSQSTPSSQVPEPSTFFLMITGLGVLLFRLTVSKMKLATTLCRNIHIMPRLEFLRDNLLQSGHSGTVGRG